jgi:nucleoside-triphosphatase
MKELGGIRISPTFPNVQARSASPKRRPETDQPMHAAPKNLLLTGIPGIGKTTMMINLFGSLKDLNPVGFYTEEIREEGVRKGFELVSLDGRRSLLSHERMKSPYRIGKYRVDLKGFEHFLSSIPALESPSPLVLIDEIGKMECLSNRFKKFLIQVFDSPKRVIATVALRGEGFISEIKKRADVRLIEITEQNRNALLSDFLKEIDPSRLQPKN